MSDKCPYCDEIIDLQRAWSNSDYAIDFRFVCGGCDNTIQVYVESVPEFYVTKLRCAKCKKRNVGSREYCDDCYREIREIER